MNIITSTERVFIDADKHYIYETLRKKGTENPDDFPFHTMKDIFMLAVYLGKRNNAFKPLDTNKQEIFQGDVFNSRTDIPVLAAVVYSKERKLEKLTDPKYLLEIAQGYANGGIIFVAEKLIESAGKSRLFNFINLIYD